MGIPIKKRINYADRGDSGPAPCGLDLLSAAAAVDARLSFGARPEKPPPSSSSSSSPGPPQAPGTIAPSSTREESSGGDDDGEESSAAAPEAVASLPTAAAASSGRKKRSRPFPAVLRDILSDPEHDSVIAWLPRGRSFAVHDTHKFSTEVLPKYYRRVAFRSFARKLNRWGFRSLRKSVSGVQVAFEHDSFRRDEPELSEGMRCRSNPATNNKGQRAAAAEASAGRAPRAVPARPAPRPVETPSRAVPLRSAPAPTRARTRTKQPVVTPPSSGGAAGAAGAAVPRVPPGAAALLAAAASALRGDGTLREDLPAAPPAPVPPCLPPRDGEAAVRAAAGTAPRGADRDLRLPAASAAADLLAARLRDELVLRELRRRLLRERERERGEALRFLRREGTPAASASDAAFAEGLRRRMLERQLLGRGGY